MPRKALEPTTTITVRLPTSMVSALDEEAERLRRETPGLQATRADALRYFISMGQARLDMSAFREPRIYDDEQLERFKEQDRIPLKTCNWLKKYYKR
ncbi:MAG TPA: hypothetical protein PKO06_15840 [Candidatus Ozemobacteraceae bacterium]|nr:hypothetical protein [Candidatus Ozemobacteraceae bacterium]